MNPNLQRRVQRYGWDKASEFYQDLWQVQLKPAHDLLLKTSDVRNGDNIIDIAAGTGLISFRLNEIAGANGSVMATDISDKMIEIGTNLCLTNTISNVRFERMDAEALNCEDDTYDLATCALGLMYFPEPDIALGEMFRVLKPTGKATVAVWGSRKNCGWAEIFPIVDARVNTDVCPMFFNLGEGNVLDYVFDKVGFKNIRSQKIKTTLQYSTDEEACDAAFIGGPVAMAYSRFDSKTKHEARLAYLESIKAYKTKVGYEIPGEFIVCSGTKN
ncbi:dimethylmenaquinone methyltransferase [Flavobacteriales bacterium 34_180_T64]|nr:dimethylmenaquinone methyltransferase [Flavobacteriales bacterium 34_180_T64]